MAHKSTLYLAWLGATSEFAANSGQVPDLIHLLPKGELKTQDGRKGFSWGEGAAIIMCSWDGVDQAGSIPVDVNHSNAKRGPDGHDSPAVGWISDLIVKDDGLWGRVTWNDQGKSLIASKSYRGVSPEIMVDPASGLIRGIRGASLVNHPNLKGLQPIFHSAEEEEDDMKFLEKLGAALKLQDSADEAAVLAAAATLASDTAALRAQLQAVAKAAGVAADAKPEAVLLAVQGLADPAKAASPKVIEELRAELQSATVRHNELVKKIGKEKAEAFVDGEMKKGRVGLTPAMRDHYVVRHMASDADAAAVEKEIQAMPMLSGTRIIPAAPPKDGETILAEEDRLVAQALGVSPEAMKKARAADTAAREGALQ